MHPRRTVGLRPGVLRPPSLRPARSRLREPSPTNAPPPLAVEEVESTALTARIRAINLFDAVKQAADLSHDAYVEHVLEQVIGPMLARHDAWNPNEDQEQKSAVRELARLRVYFREIVRVTSSAWDISRAQQHYSELLEAAHQVVPFSTQSQEVMVRFTAPLQHFQSGHVGAYAELRRYVIKGVQDKTVAAVTHEHATAALADLTLAIMRACSQLRSLMDPHALAKVERALASIGPNWWEYGPDHEAEGVPEEEERNPYAVPRPALDFQFLYWRSELFLAMQRQP